MKGNYSNIKSLIKLAIMETKYPINSSTTKYKGRNIKDKFDAVL
jgi:hypothetical protein